ncbi:MAG: hypothetical protein M1823_005898 [Watsoniomyces obsoletus]|nr:MAG: hypothetical protein M1823_005898 [Watsoniomyces obsoletus]
MGSPAEPVTTAVPRAPIIAGLSSVFTTTTPSGALATTTTTPDRERAIAPKALSPDPRSPKSVTGRSPRVRPSLTGAAAMAAERHSRSSNGSNPQQDEEAARGQSPNPAVHALESLLGHGQSQGMSRPQDAPPAATTTMSEAVASAAQAMSVSAQDPTIPAVSTSLPSPMSTVSASSLVSLDATAPSASTATTGSISALPVGSSVLGDPSQASSDTRTDPRLLEASATSTTANATDARAGNRSFTFPGPLLGVGGAAVSTAVEGLREPARGVSLPMPESNTTPGSRSSSGATKKHKCPYCTTEFTRHHNLKSHLLTHSHEKPFVCNTCQARFRRLHDLKRHSKLHTGERPHICRRCGRRFARGDALARHNKGQGGCAGRRASVGSYVAGDGDDDDLMEEPEGDGDGEGEAEGGPDEHMEGLLYGSDLTDPDRMDEDGSPSGRVDAIDHARRPSLARASGAAFPHSPHHPAHSSTYPPTGGRQRLPGPFGSRRLPPSGAGMNHALHQPAATPIHAPPAPGFPTPDLTNSSGTGSSGPGHVGGGGMSSILAHGGMVESPAPLTPPNLAGGSPRRLDSANAAAVGGSTRPPRSPSLTQQFQQRQFGRRPSGRSPPQPGLPPPLGGVTRAGAPSLPSLSGLGPVDAKMAARAFGGEHQQPHLHPPPVSSNPAVASPLSRAGALMPSDVPAPAEAMATPERAGVEDGVSGRAEAPPSTTEHLFAYIRTLESKINQLSDELLGVRRELATSAPHRPTEPNHPGTGSGGGSGDSGHASTISTTGL